MVSLSSIAYAQRLERTKHRLKLTPGFDDLARLVGCWRLAELESLYRIVVELDQLQCIFDERTASVARDSKRDGIPDGGSRLPTIGVRPVHELRTSCHLYPLLCRYCPDSSAITTKQLSSIDHYHFKGPSPKRPAHPNIPSPNLARPQFTQSRYCGTGTGSHALSSQHTGSDGNRS